MSNAVQFLLITSKYDRVSHICKTTSFHLRNVGRIRTYLCEDADTKITTAMVTSRLNYCNGLLSNISKEQIERLPQIENTSARIIANPRKFDHITPFHANFIMDHFQALSLLPTDDISNLSLRVLTSLPTNAYATIQRQNAHLNNTGCNDLCKKDP